MKITEPISPNDIEKHISAYLIDEAVQYLNQKISCREWHNQFTGDKDLLDNYYAVILSPVNHFNAVMDEVVSLYTNKGWQCRWGGAYDARGPHHCFYISKKHFTAE